MNLKAGLVDYNVRYKCNKKKLGFIAVIPNKYEIYGKSLISNKFLSSHS